MGPGIDNEPLPLETSTPVLTSEEILSLATTYECRDLTWEDMEKISSTYPAAIDEAQAIFMLANELKNNLRDTDGERTPNFLLLVELGLLDGRHKHSFGDDSTAPKHPTGGCRLLTRKGAAFLGIDLGVFNTCEQIVWLQKDCAKKVEGLVNTRDREVKLAELFAKIIQNEPLLQSKFPPHYSISTLLRDILCELSLFKRAGAGVEISANYRGMEHASKLGWIPSEWWEKKKMGDWSLIYDKLAGYIDEFNSIFRV